MSIFDNNIEEQLDRIITEKQRQDTIRFLSGYVPIYTYRVAMKEGEVHLHRDPSNSYHMAACNVAAKTYRLTDGQIYHVNEDDPCYESLPDMFSYIDIIFKPERMRWEICPRDKRFPILLVSGFRHMLKENVQNVYFEEGTHLLLRHIKRDPVIELEAPIGGSLTQSHFSNGDI